MISILKKSLFSVTMLILMAGLVFGLMLANGGFQNSGAGGTQQGAGVSSATKPSEPVLNGTWLETLDFIDTVDANNVITRINAPDLTTSGAAGTAKGTDSDYVDGYDFTKSGGVTGIGNDPYQITNPYQLAYLAYRVNYDSSVSFAGKTFVLDNDLDLSGHRWVAIGNYTAFFKDNGATYHGRAFNGSFDGGNNTISGLSVISEYTADYGYSFTTTSSSYNIDTYDGLFGDINETGAQVKNLTIDSPYIEVSSNIRFKTASASSTITLYSHLYVGAVAGDYTGNAAISNINVINPYINASTNNDLNNGYDTTYTLTVNNYEYIYIGGLVGRYSGGLGFDSCVVSGNNALLDQSGSSLNVISINPSRGISPKYYPYSHVGGLFGEGTFGTTGGNLDYAPQIIDSSVNAELRGGYRIGGIGAYVRGYQSKHVNAENLTFEGSINSNIDGYQSTPADVITSRSSYVGGIFGQVAEAVDMTECINSANIVNNIGPYTGGLVGKYDETSSSGKPKTFIKDSSNSGNIESRANTTASYTGGLVGIIHSSYSTLKISNSENTGLVKTKYGNIGGLVGYFESYYANAGFDAGLENCVNNGIVESSDISGTYTASMGGLIGCGIGLTITGSENLKTVSALSTSTTNYVGGLVGQLRYSIMQNCHNEAQVTTTANGTYFGGIAGSLIGLSSYEDNSSLENVYNTGNIVSLSGNRIGGIAGQIENYALSNVYNAGDITLTSGNYIGGVAGYITGINYDNAKFENVYNTGNIRGTSTVSYAGGVAGYVSSYTLEDVYNTGDVIFTNSDVPSLAGTGTYVGGVVGTLYRGNLYNSYNTGRIAGRDQVGGVVGDIQGSATITAVVRSCRNTGYINASGSYTGGIAGRAYYGALIEDCYNAYGGTENEEGAINRMNGGIVGGIYAYTHMENDIVVRNCFNAVNVGHTGNYVSGIVGYIYYGYASSVQSAYQQKQVLIENCYTSGIAYKAVVGTSVKIGGIVGNITYGSSAKYAAVEIKNSFWTSEELEDVSEFLGGYYFIYNDSFASANIGYVNYQNSSYISTVVTVDDEMDENTGAAFLSNKTSAELKDQATYPAFAGGEGWNFGDVMTANNLTGIWIISAEQNGGYPMLRSWTQSVMSFYANDEVLHLYGVKGEVLDIASANAIAANAKPGYLFGGWKSYDDYSISGGEWYGKNAPYGEDYEFIIADKNARFDAIYDVKARYKIELSGNSVALQSGEVDVSAEDYFVEIGGGLGDKVLYATAFSNNSAFQASAYWAVYNTVTGEWDTLERYFKLDLSPIIADNAAGANFINNHVQYGANDMPGTIGTIQIKLVEVVLSDNTYSFLTFVSNIGDVGSVEISLSTDLGNWRAQPFDGGENVLDGTVVEVRAIADEHYRFVGFMIGEIEYLVDTLTLIAGVNFTSTVPVYVMFEPIEYSITVVEEEDGVTLGDVSGLIAYSAEDVSLNDTAAVWLSAEEQNSGYIFISWAIYNYTSERYETLFENALFGDYTPSVTDIWITNYVRNGEAKIAARVVAKREVSLGLNEINQSWGYELGNIEIENEDFIDLSLETSGSLESAYTTTGSKLRFTLDQVGDNARYYELAGIYTTAEDAEVEYSREGDWYVVSIMSDTNIYVKLDYKEFGINFVATDELGNEIRLGEAVNLDMNGVRVGDSISGSDFSGIAAPAMAGYRWTGEFYLKSGSGTNELLPVSDAVIDLDMNSIENNVAYVGGTDMFQIVGRYIKTYTLTVSAFGNGGSSEILVYETNETLREATQTEIEKGFDRGTRIRVEATNNKYYGFDGFGGVEPDELDGEDAVVIELGSNRNVTAMFSADEYAVSDDNIEMTGSGEVSIDKQKIRIGDSITIVVSPAGGQDIAKFVFGGVNVLSGSLPSNMTYSNGILTLTMTAEWMDEHGFDLDAEISFAKNPTVFIVLGAAGGALIIAAAVVLVLMLNYNKKRKFIKAQLLNEQAAKYKLNTGSFVQDLREGKSVGQVTDEDIKKAMKDRKGKK